MRGCATKAPLVAAFKSPNLLTIDASSGTLFVPDLAAGTIRKTVPGCRQVCTSKAGTSLDFNINDSCVANGNVCVPAYKASITAPSGTVVQ